MVQQMSKRAQYERVFSHFDENKDGKISPSELRQCVCALGGETIMSLEEVEKAVGDGILLGVDDFVKFVEGEDEEEKLKDLKEAFKMYHEKKDDDGSEELFITPKSLKRMLSKLLGESVSIDQCVVMISHFDLDGDGALSFNEFKIMMS